MGVYAVSGLGQKDFFSNITDVIGDTADVAFTELRRRGEYELQKELCDQRDGHVFSVDKEGNYLCTPLRSTPERTPPTPHTPFPVYQKQRSQTHLYLIGAAVIGVALFAIARMRG